MQPHPFKRFLMKHLTHEQLLALRRVKNAAASPLLGRRPAEPALSDAPHESLDEQSAHAEPAPACVEALAPAEHNYGIETEEARLGLLWPWNYEVSRLPSRMASGRAWPRISVVTVTYNQGAFLEETIRSVLLQGYPNLEYIVVDGGSTDNTRHVLDRYRAELSVVISEPDKGQSDALNKGFAHATGDILAWLNSDDQYFPGALRAVAEAFDRFDTDLVVGGAAVIRDFRRDPVGVHHCIFPLEQVTPLPLAQLADFEGEWQKAKFFYQPEVFWSRAIWEKAGGRVEDRFRFAMDYELWLRFASLDARIVHVPDDVAIFRFHEAQKTKWRSGEDYPEHVAVGRLYSHAPPAQTTAPARNPDAPVDIQETIPKSIFDQRPVCPYSTPAGQIFVPADGIQDEACRAIREGRVYRADAVEAALEFVRPGSIVLDVGSGVGQAALLFSQKVGPRGQVLAFEADEYLFDTLLRNRDTNSAENLRAFQGVVHSGAHAEVVFPKLQYRRFPSYSTQRADPAATSGARVPAFSLDTLEIDGPVSLLHVHAPGSELEILSGARALIARNRMPIVIDALEDESGESGRSAAALADVARDIGYRVARTIRESTHVLLPVQELATTAPAAGDRVAAIVRSSPAAFRASRCKILRSRAEVDECTRWLKRNGYVSHNLVCKDWDLAHIVADVGDGNFLDMGSSDSYVLKNVCIKGTRGDKYGIDFNPPDVPLSEVKYMIGDLMDTKLPSGHFQYITCLSVLEHQVDYERFAAEVSRLLTPGGQLFVTFDYWEPRVVPPVKLYGLDWRPLDAERTRILFAACAGHGLHLEQEFDWSLGDPVIRWGYYSPHPDVKYTFAMASFRKK